MTLILGIDPGRQGAVAVFDKAARTVVTHDMPDTTGGLVDLFASLPPVRLCCIEKPFYPRAIGITNAARIAEAYGSLICILAVKGIPTHDVRPAEWKAALNLNSSKAASREKATQFFPDNADQWKRARDDGRAEAALIAWYALRFCK